MGVWAGVYVCVWGGVGVWAGVCAHVYVRGERTCGLVFVHYQ